MYVHSHTVRFSEVDGAGIVFFSRVFEIAHAAYEAFLLDQGAPLQDLLAEADWVLPLVHAEADYHAPLRLGDRVDVEVRVEATGASSIRLRFELRTPTGEPRATVRHVHVAIDRASFRSRDLPDVVRSLHRP